MQQEEKKGPEMASNSNSSHKNPKKSNFMDPHSIKHLLDESVTEIVSNHGYVEDVRRRNIRFFMGSIIIIIALIAQFYPQEVP